MLLSFFLLLLVASSYGYGLFLDNFDDQVVTYLRAGHPHVQNGLTMLQSFYSQNRIHIYCRRDQPLHLKNIFQSNRLQLITKAASEEYRQYRAPTALGVYEAHLQRRECHEGKLLAARSQQVHYITLPAHAHSCYGIYTNQAYSLTLLQVRCDGERVARFVLGVVLWLTERWSQLGNQLICCYCVTTVLGVHLTSVGVVCIALISRGDHQLKYLRPLASNFKLVVLQHPSSVTLALIAGAWIVLNMCHRNRDLWERSIVRSAHCRLLRLLAYVLILCSSNHARFGWICVGLLLPWPELRWLHRWFLDQMTKAQRNVLPPGPRRLVNLQEFQAQAGYETQRALGNMRQRLREETPTWEQMARLMVPQQFAQFLSSGTHAPEELTCNVCLDTCSRQVQTSAENIADAEAVIQQHLDAVMHEESSTSISPSSSDESLYRNLHFTGSTRSLRRH